MSDCTKQEVLMVMAQAIHADWCHADWCHVSYSTLGMDAAKAAFAALENMGLIKEGVIDE